VLDKSNQSQIACRLFCTIEAHPLKYMKEYVG
jgi:hypothetical protein